MSEFVSFIFFIELCTVGSICFYLLSKIYEEFTEADKNFSEHTTSKVPAYIYTPFKLDSDSCSYIGILVILDYETPVSIILSEIKLNVPDNRRIIMDNLLKQGLGKYRFMSFYLTGRKVNFLSVKEEYPEDNIIKQANNIWKEHKNILRGSIITPSIQKDLFE